MAGPFHALRALAERVAGASPPKLVAGLAAGAGLLSVAVVPLMRPPAPTAPDPPARSGPPAAEGAAATPPEARREPPRDAPAAPPAPAGNPAAGPSTPDRPVASVPAADPPGPAPVPPPGPAIPGSAGGTGAGEAVALAPPVRLPDPHPEPPPIPDLDGTPKPWTSVPQPALVDKAEVLLAKGEVASARLWLTAALDRGDAGAAFRLAETYDPAVLAQWGVVGLASDTARARDLYAKALAGGVGEARDRIDRLARPAAGQDPAAAPRP